MTTDATTDPVGAARLALPDYLARRADTEQAADRFAAVQARGCVATGGTIQQAWDAARFRELLAARDLADAVAPLLAHVAALEAQRAAGDGPPPCEGQCEDCTIPGQDALLCGIRGCQRAARAADSGAETAPRVGPQPIDTDTPLAYSNGRGCDAPVARETRRWPPRCTTGLHGMSGITARRGC